MRNFISALRDFAGLGINRTGHLEKWLSAAGGLAGIAGVVLISETYLGFNGSAGLVASMGASAVLLFAVPHGPLSQPWPVLGGHLVSAVIGVACAKLIAQPMLGGAVAVGLAIGAMHYLRCIHPPGGATALTAVAGGEAVHALGFHYVLTPVLMNVMVILFVAILFNFPFPWRRYPAAWIRTRHEPATSADNEQAAPVVFSREELTAAAGAIDRTSSIGTDDLTTVCDLAQCNAAATGMDPADIRLGDYYCNGEFSARWQVRRVIDGAAADVSESPADETITFTVVAGAGRRHTCATTRADFAAWARYEVRLNESSWQRVDPPPCPAINGDAA